MNVEELMKVIGELTKLIEGIKDEAYSKGYDNGFNEGWDDGYKEGRQHYRED